MAQKGHTTGVWEQTRPNPSLVACNILHMPLVQEVPNGVAHQVRATDVGGAHLRDTPDSLSLSLSQDLSLPPYLIFVA
jgi:hypothetical protein